jgi:hypothetical protein
MWALGLKLLNARILNEVVTSAVEVVSKQSCLGLADTIFDGREPEVYRS